jgi:tetratricopeptide (TPR) repeat protein
MQRFTHLQQPQSIFDDQGYPTPQRPEIPGSRIGEFRGKSFPGSTAPAVLVGIVTACGYWVEGLKNEGAVWIQKRRYYSKQAFDGFLSKQCKITHDDVNRNLQLAGGNFFVGYGAKRACPRPLGLFDKAGNYVYTSHANSLGLKDTGKPPFAAPDIEDRTGRSSQDGIHNRLIGAELTALDLSGTHGGCPWRSVLIPGVDDLRVTEWIYLHVSSAASHWTRAWSLWDFQGADEDFRRALTIEPENSRVLSRYSNSVLMPTGRLDEAVTMAKQALKGDPLNAEAWARLGADQYYHDDYLAARESLERSLEINPEQSWAAAQMAVTFLLMGDPASALPTSQGATGEEFRLQGAALAEHDLGDVKGAEQRLHELIAKHADGAAYQIAEVYAWWGDKDNAFQWLDRAYVQHDGGLTYIKVNPLLKSLRPDPRYKAFLHKMNLPE